MQERLAGDSCCYLFMASATRVNNVNNGAVPFSYCLCLFGVAVMSLSGASTRGPCGELIKMSLGAVFQKKRGSQDRTKILCALSNKLYGC